MLTKLDIFSSMIRQESTIFLLSSNYSLFESCRRKVGSPLYDIRSLIRTPLEEEIKINIRNAEQLGARFIFKNKSMKEIINAN